MADSDFPDLYTDSVAVSVGSYGVAMTLYLSDPTADDPFRKTIGRVRMSIDLARAVNQLLAASLAKIPPPAPPGPLPESQE